MRVCSVDIKDPLIFLLFCILITGCKETIEYKPLIMSRPDGALIEDSCIAKLVNGEFVQAYCFYSGGDTLLIENVRHGRRNGPVLRKYKSGAIMTKGQYLNDQKFGVWYKYYENGEIKRYSYWKAINNKSLLYYDKTYSPEGVLDSFLLPIDVSIISQDSILYVDSTYILVVELLYSEYDSVHSGIVVQDVDGTKMERDTALFIGNKAGLKFTPTRAGENYIKGDYIEINGLKNLSESEGYSASQAFNYVYTSEEYDSNNSSDSLEKASEL